jgi:hypothetical protein
MFGNNNQPYGGYNQQQNYGGYPQQQAPATKLESLDDLLTGSGAKSYFNGDSQPGATITGTLDLIENQPNERLPNQTTLILERRTAANANPHRHPNQPPRPRSGR